MFDYQTLYFEDMLSHISLCEYELKDTLRCRQAYLTGKGSSEDKKAGAKLLNKEQQEFINSSNSNKVELIKDFINSKNDLYLKELTERR